MEAQEGFERVAGEGWGWLVELLIGFIFIKIFNSPTLPYPTLPYSPFPLYA